MYVVIMIMQAIGKDMRKSIMLKKVLKIKRKIKNEYTDY